MWQWIPLTSIEGKGEEFALVEDRVFTRFNVKEFARPAEGSRIEFQYELKDGDREDVSILSKSMPKLGFSFSMFSIFKGFA